MRQPLCVGDLLNCSLPPLEHQTQTEQAAGNPLARMIVGAKWNENKVCLYIHSAYFAFSLLAPHFSFSPTPLVFFSFSAPKVTMALEDPYHESGDDDEEEDSDDEEEEGGQTQRRKKQQGQKKEKVMHVDIDMALSAYANSRALYEAKKKATDKASKTVQGK